MCDLNCEINTLVCGDHAYCDCTCHNGTLPAIPPSRKRRKIQDVFTGCENCTEFEECPFRDGYCSAWNEKEV